MAAIDEAIEKGAKELGDLPEFNEGGEGENKGQKTAAAEETSNKEDDTEVTESEIESDDLTEEQLENAKTLFKMLNNPSTAKASLRFLAEQIGFELPAEKPETKQEARAQAKDIIEEMKEAAPGLEFLIDKIGPVIKKHLESQVQSVQEEIQTDRQNRENEKIVNEAAQAYTMVAKNFKYKDNIIPKNIQDEMSKMMQKITPNPDLKPIDYINMLHDAARAKLGIQQVQEKRTPSPAQRLASERVSPTRTVAASTKMSLNEAISNAVQQLSGDS